MKLTKSSMLSNQTWVGAVNPVSWLKSTVVIESTHVFDDGSMLALDVLRSLDQLVNDDQMILLVSPKNCTAENQTHLVVAHLVNKATDLEIEDYVRWLYENDSQIEAFAYDIIHCDHEVVWAVQQNRLGLFLVNDDWTTVTPLIDWEYRRGMFGATVPKWIDYNTLVMQFKQLLVDQIATTSEYCGDLILAMSLDKLGPALFNRLLVTQHELHYFRVIADLFSATVDCSVEWGNVHSAELASRKVAQCGKRKVIDISKLTTTDVTLNVS